MSHDRQLRALVVAPTPTWPLNYGNRKRIFSVCSKLKSIGFSIYYVHYASEADWRDYIPEKSRQMMDKQWDFVDHVWPSIPLHDWPKDGDDHRIDEWWDWSLENHLSKLFSARDFDLTVVNYTWLSKALEFAPPRTLKVLDTHDKFSGRRELLTGKGIQKEFFHTTEDQEVIALNRADRVWAIKDEEKEAFENMGALQPVRTLLHLDTLRQSIPFDCNNGVTFGFIGANNNINRVNILRFIEVATPIFQKFCAPLTIKIAGSICHEINCDNNPFFKKVGYVDSVDTFYDNIHAAIIPMEFSTGLKIKVAEALSQNKALISHKHAMEGFTATHEYHQLESFEKFALAMVDLSYQPSELQRLTEASNKTYSKVEQQIDSELEKVKDIIIEKQQILVVLPEEYGNKKKIAHYIAQARVDLLNWNYSSVLFVICASPRETESHANFIRFLNDAEFQALIDERKFHTLLNLSEEFNRHVIPKDLNVISLTEIDQLKPTDYLLYRSFTSVSDEDYFPSIGHIHYENEAVNQKLDECWIIGDGEQEHIKMLIKLLSPGLKTRDLQLKKMSDIDDLLLNTTGLPQHVFIAKKERSLNYCEQILLELAIKYGVEIKDGNQNQLLSVNRDDVVSKYENQFFPVWEKFVKNKFLSTKNSFLR